MNEHDAHAPYLAAVAEALQAAGIPVAHHHADPGDPRDGAIELFVPAGDPITLGWTEERGWYRGTERPDSYGELHRLYETPIYVLATPAEVVAWVKAVLAGTDRDRPMYAGGGYWRQAGDADDFDAQLRAAAPAQGGARVEHRG